MRRQALSLLVENNPGVTSRISGLFSRRGFNIDSFSSGVTADPRYTRITIVASGDEQVLEQIDALQTANIGYYADFVFFSTSTAHIIPSTFL